MPTPKGLPKKGERVMLQIKLPGEIAPEPRYGTVVSRGTGDYWTLYVRWDDQRVGDRMKEAYGQPGVTMMVDAAYQLRMGWLKIVTDNERS